MNNEQNLELRQKAAKDLLRSMVNEVLDDFLGVDQTYSQADIQNAERGLAYLLKEGITRDADKVPDPWGGDGDEMLEYHGPGDWRPLTDAERECIADGAIAEKEVHTGLFLDIEECRFVVGPDGFQFIDDNGDCMTISSEDLPAVARLFRQATDVGYIEYLPNR